ncbi:glycosyl transferase [Bacteroidia bacterium]|nr:glycosyl transferase [Bacteroidia bacterium]GHV70186.1 glycosyl transferase [Bacteroidia bacterium]
MKNMEKKKYSIKISIVMPVYNADAYLAESIQSILNQTLVDFELIIIDDGSTDNTTQIVRSFSDIRIVLLRNEHDFIGSLNLGIKQAKGKYIARMDADDAMLPNRLQVQYDFMEQNQTIDVCGSWAEIFGDGDGLLRTPIEHKQIVAIMLLYNPMIHPSVIMRRSVLKYLRKPYKRDYPAAEDYKLWIDLAGKGARFANIPQVLLRYRQSPNQVTKIQNREMSLSSLKIRIKYAEQIMKQITGKDKYFLDFFDQLIGLLNKNLIDFYQMLNIVYQIYNK